MNQPSDSPTTRSSALIRKEGGLAGFALRKPITMLMMFLSILVVGFISYQNIPIRLLPAGIDFPYLWLWFVYPNSSPVESFERIAKPVEQSLWTVKGVKQIRSRASQERCTVQMEFQQNADMDVAYSDVRDRIERIRPELPDDFRYYYIYRYSESDQPIFYFAITVNSNHADPYRLIQEEVGRKLEQIDGVARVDIEGKDAKIVRIDLKLDRLRAHGIDIGLLLTQLQRANFALAGGTVLDSDKQLFIRVDSRIRTLQELRDLPVKGDIVRLGDIAEVQFTEPTSTGEQRINGEQAVQVAVYKSSEGNTVELGNKLNATLAEFERNPRLAGLQFNVLFDQGEFITNSIDTLLQSGMWGGVFAVFVLYFFMRRVRMTLFVTLGIPLSLLMTVIALYFMGWSLDIVTLSGLMICVGMVVDNAIVVVENILTLRQSGKSIRTAVLEGTNEVGLAITTATLTTVVVFLPLILLGDNKIFSFYLARIGMPVIIALLASLFVALLFIPLTIERFAIQGSAKESRLVIWGAEWVSKMVAWSLNHRLDTTVLLIIILASIAIPIKQVVSTDQEQGGINDITLRFDFPQYYSLEAIDSTISNMESFLKNKQAEYGIKTVMSGYRRGRGRVQVFLQEDQERQWYSQALRKLKHHLNITPIVKKSSTEIIKDIKESYIPPAGVTLHTSWASGRGGDGSLNISVYGDETVRLLGIADDITRRIETLPNVISVEPDLENSADEVQMVIDRDGTARLGIDPRQAVFGVSALIRGVNLPDVRINNYDVTVWAELREDDRRTLEQVKNLPVSGSQDIALTLDDIGEFRYEKGLGEITSENRRTRVGLKIQTTEEDIGDFSRQLDKVLGDLNLPLGYEWSKGSRFSDVDMADEDRNNAWILAIAFVFLLMGALFESVWLPFAVIITVPFSFIGVWWMLFLTGTQFGIMAGVGVVILIGVIVNNAIVLVDRANFLRKQGQSVNTALINASAQRFRPIMMTALTTILGLLPMAVGDSNLVGIPYSPMGRTMIGGMLIGTLTTPVVVCLTYSYIISGRSWLRDKFANLRKDELVIPAGQEKEQ